MVEIIKQEFDENKKKYKYEEKRLKCVLGEDVLIEHVGSTAIPDMVGKNIIDILVGAKDEREFEEFKFKIKEMGYFPSTGSANNIYQFFASREEETGDGDVHIHLVIDDTKRYRDFIVLRNYLLNNCDEAKAYAQCKLDILQNITSDRRTYRNVKSDYVTKLIERAYKSLK